MRKKLPDCVSSKRKWRGSEKRKKRKKGKDYRKRKSVESETVVVAYIEVVCLLFNLDGLNWRHVEGAKRRSVRGSKRNNGGLRNRRKLTGS